MVSIKSIAKWSVGAIVFFWVVGAIVQGSSWFKVYCAEEAYYNTEQCAPIKYKALWALSTGDQKLQLNATLEAHSKHCLKPVADKMVSDILSSIK